MTPSPAITKIIQAARDARDGDGCAHISAKDVAKLVKPRLAAEFPGVKFSVTSDFNSVNIHWDGFPMQDSVEAIVRGYKFGGFDGSIDMEYSSECWLLPDGRIVPAACKGTRGQRGAVAEFATDCPQPGAVLVRGGAQYIFANQNIPAEAWAEAILSVSAERGEEADLSRGVYNCVLDGEFALRDRDVQSRVAQVLADGFESQRPAVTK